MIVKCIIKYLCFMALVLYGMMTMNIMRWIWKRYKIKTEPYETRLLSDKELERFDVNQINMLQKSVEVRDDYGINNTIISMMDTNERLGTEHLKAKGNIKVSEKFVADNAMFVTVGQISVFSAYYDNRKGLEYPLVRIMGLSSKESNDNLVCGFLESVMGPWILAEKYEMCENHGKLYGGYMFNCRIPDHVKIIPKKVYLQSLMTISEHNKPNISTSVALDITHFKHRVHLKEKYTDKKDTNEETKGNKSRVVSLNNKTEENLTIGVCVSPMYGKINLSNLIQFLELLKLQGVYHIIIYKMAISKSVQILLEYYESKGDITVVNWTLPSFIQTNRIWYNGQIVMIQDCLYKVMGNFDYVAFLDLDEIIIPKLDFEWSKLIQRLQIQSKLEYPEDDIAGFSFKSAFFDPDKQTTNSQKLSFLKTLQRNEILSKRRTKVIVEPNLVVEMGIHHVSSTIYNNHDKIVYDVSPNVGLIHHFRKCTTQLDPDMNCEISTEDTSITKYDKPLTMKYNKALRYNMKYFRTLS